MCASIGYSSFRVLIHPTFTSIRRFASLHNFYFETMTLRGTITILYPHDESYVRPVRTMVSTYFESRNVRYCELGRLSNCDSTSELFLLIPLSQNHSIVLFEEDGQFGFAKRDILNSRSSIHLILFPQDDRTSRSIVLGDGLREFVKRQPTLRHLFGDRIVVLEYSNTSQNLSLLKRILNLEFNRYGKVVHLALYSRYAPCERRVVVASLLLICIIVSFSVVWVVTNRK